MKFNKTILAGLLTISGLPVAHAGLINADLAGPALSATVTVNGISSLFDLGTAGQAIDKGAGTSLFTGSSSNTNWDFGWDISANADPFITGNLNFTNTTATDQTFNIVLALPTVLISGPVQETGELGLVLKDSGSLDGTASLTLNQWHGLINPLTPPPLLDMPLLIGSTLNCGGASCVSILSPVSNTQIHSAVDHNGNAISSIGTHINFTLSAGDTVSISTKWNVAPIPVPAAVWLFASGLAGLIGTARLRKHPL